MGTVLQAQSQVEQPRGPDFLFNSCSPPVGGAPPRVTVLGEKALQATAVCHPGMSRLLAWCFTSRDRALELWLPGSSHQGQSLYQALW